MKEVQRLIEAHCRANNKDIHQGLNELLDYLLEFFDYSIYFGDDYEKHLLAMKAKSENLFAITMDWLQRVTKQMNKGSWIDYFGELYETMYQSKSKSSTLGQFFTPPSLCDLMSKVVYTGNKGKQTINDCACGSGRTLLSHFASADDKTGYYIGEDVDMASVKMCALNMMIHGMRGRVICHDTLKNPIKFDVGYEINEVRYPIPTPYYSLRRISNPKK